MNKLYETECPYFTLQISKQVFLERYVTAEPKCAMKFCTQKHLYTCNDNSKSFLLAVRLSS
jgi:hypothetical protein